MKNVLLYLLLCLSLAACKKSEDATPEGVSIRVKNASQYQFESVYVNSVHGENAYGTLGAGLSSDYKPFAQAYRYSYIKAVVKGRTLELHPFCTVGEELLKPGHYTYVLNVEDFNGREVMTLDCEDL